jgi:tetratricopeptide (TPR) repeat protein
MFLLAALAREAAPGAESPSTSPVALAGADTQQVNELERQIAEQMDACQFEKAAAAAEALEALRRDKQGRDHWETVSAHWRAKALGKVAKAPPDEQSAYRDSYQLTAEAKKLRAGAKYAEAQSRLEKCLAIRRRLLGEEHPHTAGAYSNLAATLSDQGKFDQAATFYEKALQTLSKTLGREHPETATGHSNLALNLRALGKYAEAKQHLEKALEIHRRALGENDPTTANSYNNLAFVLDAKGNYTEAQPLYEKALSIFLQSFGESHPLTASTYSNLAVVMHRQGRFRQAQILSEKALQVHRQLLGDEHPDTSSIYNNLALHLNAQGKHAQAQPLLEKALLVSRQALGEEHPLTAVSYNNLAANLQDQRKYAEAQRLYEKALGICLQCFDEEHPETAISYNNLAAVLSDQENHAEAQPFYEKALNVWRRQHGADHPETATSCGNLALSLNAQGKYSQAKPLLEEALDIRRRLLGQDHPLTAKSYNNLAGNLYSQGDYPTAQPLFENALSIYRKALGEYHPDTIESYLNLSNNLVAQGKHTEALATWLPAARAFETVRLQVAFAGMERSTWSTKNSPLKRVASAAARLQKYTTAWQWLERHLGRGLLDELASRSERLLSADERQELDATRNRLAQLDQTLWEGLPSEKRDRLIQDRTEASIRLGELQTQLAAKYGSAAGKVASLEEIQAVLEEDRAVIAWLDLAPLGPRAADPDGEHWGIVLRRHGPPVWVDLPGSGPDGRWTKEDAGLARAFRRAIARPSGSATEDWPTLAARLRKQRLEPLVPHLAATPDGLPAVRSMVVLPSGAMTGIPVSAILNDTDDWAVSYSPSGSVLAHLRRRRAASGGLLALGDPVFAPPPEVESLPKHGLLVTAVLPDSNAARAGLRPGDVLLTYNDVVLNETSDLKRVTKAADQHKAGSVSVEVWRRGQVARRQLAPGRLGVNLAQQPAPVALRQQQDLDKVLLAARSGSEIFDPLPASRVEVQNLAEQFANVDRPAQTWVGAEAGEPRLDQLNESGELAGFAYLHLATHGVIDEQFPQRSAVILSQVGLPDPLEQAARGLPVYDGRVSMGEIRRRWRLNAELVTLSACDSALGKREGGEGLVGFTQALLMSGARSVCLSLWKVDDAATALFMQRLYANLLGAREGLPGPMPKARALAEAQKWLRELSPDEVLSLSEPLWSDAVRHQHAKDRGKIQLDKPLDPAPARVPKTTKPYEHPYYWAAFVMVGDPG